LINVGVTAYAEASAGIGPAYLGSAGGAGANVENQLGFFPYADYRLEYGLEWGWAFRIGAAIGGEIIFY
jgi:hypothetical protein